MGVSDAIARSAAAHAHALVVEVPGWWRTRAAVERAALSRGWRLALSPADADVLVVCGAPGHHLGAAVEVVWQQMPGPRVRVEVGEYDDVPARLDEAHAALLDSGRHRHDAQHRRTPSDLLAERAEPAPTGHEGMDHGEHEGHGGHEGMDRGGHEGHGDMDMSPSGVPLAEGGEDRDGLEMDVLTVRLGPVLLHWPAGLVLRCSLQGDVITTARAETVDGPDTPDLADSDPAAGARSLDNIASCLALAGWGDAAAEARRIRDLVLEQGWTEATGARLDRLCRKVCRSRLLRWSLRGLRPVGEDDVHRHGLPPYSAGDTYDRLIRMVDRVTARSGDHAGAASGPSYSPEQVAHLVNGLDLAAARLVVAGLDVHGLRPGQSEHQRSHG